MSSIGPPSQTSLVQAAQAQQTAARQRDAERAKTDSTHERRDRVDWRVTDAQAADAVRRLPRNQSEEAESEHRRQQMTRASQRKRASNTAREQEEHPRDDDPETTPRIDVTG